MSGLTSAFLVGSLSDLVCGLRNAVGASEATEGSASKKPRCNRIRSGRIGRISPFEVLSAKNGS